MRHCGILVAAAAAAIGCGGGSGAQERAAADSVPNEREGEAHMVVTMLEARVAPDREADLVREYSGVGGGLPPFIVETFLLHSADSGLWRIVTVWRSREDLEAYRRSVDTPEGVRIFRAAGSEPALTIFDVAAHAAQ